MAENNKNRFASLKEKAINRVASLDKADVRGKAQKSSISFNKRKRVFL